MFIYRDHFCFIFGWIVTVAIKEGLSADATTVRALGKRLSEPQDASCPFEGSMCGWLNNIQHDSTPFYIEANVPQVKVPPQGVCNELAEAANEVKGGGGYAHSLREKKMRYWKTVCDKRCYYLVQQSVGHAEIESPEFELDDSTVVLQVNFSYWLENKNHSAKLQLIQIPTSGENDNSPTTLWSTENKQSDTDNWNATVLNIKQPLASKTLKLAFWGKVGAAGDLIAIDRISVAELTKDDISGRVDQMKDVHYKMESEGNSYVCPRNSASSFTMNHSVLLTVLVVFSMCLFRYR